MSRTAQEKADWAKYMREYRKVRPGVFKNQDLRKSFGMSYEDYMFLLAQQNFVCAICDRGERVINPATGDTRHLAVDHDHATGRVRGLLCTSCNTGIGKFGESLELVRRVVDYLGKH